MTGNDDHRFLMGETILTAELDELHQLSDRQLIIRSTRGDDEQAFAALVSRHGPMVLRVCRRILKNEQDAEDVYQAVFLVLAQKSRQVRWQSSIGNWLYGVACRIALHESRRMRKRHEASLADATEIAGCPEDNVESREAERVLYEELRGLPNKYRAPLVLCHLEGKSRQETARELGVNETTVKGRLERGRNMLRGKLAKRGLAIPVALLSGELADQIARAALSKSMTLATAQAATKFAAGYSLGSASATGAVGLAKGELAKMLVLSQIKWAVVVMSTAAAVGTGGVLMSHSTHGGDGASPRDVVAQADDGKSTSPDDASAASAPPSPAQNDAGNAPDQQQAQQESPELDPATVLNSLKQLALAMHNHHDFNGAFPAAARYDANQRKLLSWRVHLLPFLGEQALYDQFRLNEPWDSEHNRPLIDKMPAVFATGSSVLEQSGKTILLVPIARDTAFPGREPIRIRDITDGTSNTMMILTVDPQHAVEWTRPDDWEFDEMNPFQKLLGNQGMGLIFSLCDGAARRLDRPMSADTLKALLTRNGQEVFEL